MTIQTPIVGLDVETTSLEPARGDIIEVAAIRFDFAPGKRSGERFVRLCKPRHPISAEITALTSITNEMVAEAPSFSEIAAELEEYIGDSLIVAHNASFDVAWLRYHGLSLATNKVWDTFAIAGVAWPEAESYNLGALSQALGIKNEEYKGGRGEHSAEYDVLMTWGLLQAAQRELQAPLTAYKQIVDLLERAGLEHYLPLFSQRARSRLAPPPGGGVAPALGGPPARHPLLSSRDLLSSEGVLAQKWPDFTPRAPQQEMAAVVERVVQEGGTALIEAPTGSGKTLAYLTPLIAAPLARKAVISTYTKHLQDQLLGHDVPLLQEALGSTVRVAVLKGRSNYLCTERLRRALQRAALVPSEAWFLIKALLWLAKGGAGDLDRLNTSHAGPTPTIHADSLLCRRTCGRQEESQCPYEQALRAAEAASILIVNHALLTDPYFATRWPLGPLIIDEAHHLEEALRRATAASLQPWHLHDILSPLLQEGTQAPSAMHHLKLEAEQLDEDYAALLLRLSSFPQRLTPAIRRDSRWGVVERASQHWMGRCQFLEGLLESSTDRLAALEAADIRAALHAFRRDLARFIDGSPERIQWVETDEARERVYLHDVALDIQAAVGRLREASSGVVLTSATLTTSGDFRYIESQLGLTSAEELILPSAFPLQENLLLYLVDDAPDPREAAYDEFIADKLRTISLLLGGRTLGLFTSFKSVTAVFKQLILPLNKASIKLWAQGHSGGKSSMLKRFRETEQSVLLGTDSFWEGIDIPGATLSCVVIAKLPFSPPHDPVIEALAESQSGDSFQGFSLPHMILKLRQGIGRLVRRQDDRGVVVIFDSRLVHSSYGEAVLYSLPAGRIKIGPAGELPAAIKRWIGKKTIENWKRESKNEGSNFGHTISN